MKEEQNKMLRSSFSIDIFYAKTNFPIFVLPIAATSGHTMRLTMRSNAAASTATVR